MVAVEQFAHRAERLDDLARGGAEARHVDGYQRAPVGDLAREQGLALVLRQVGIALLHAERAEDLVERVAVHVGVLAHVQAGEVKAEHLDLADDVAQRVVGDEAGLLVAQRLLGDAQVGDELLRAVIAALGVLARRAHPLGEQLEQLAVGLAGVALEDVLAERGQPRLARRRAARAAARARRRGAPTP